MAIEAGGVRVSRSTQSGVTNSLLLSEAEHKVISEHLQAILQSPVFRNSKRVSNLLSYVVSQTLEGRSDHLKERTIGIDVFQRAPDYDTATDHCVRSTAGEVRKRLAQYYVELDIDPPLQIELRTGSYVPQFRFLPALPEHDLPQAAPIPQTSRPWPEQRLSISSILQNSISKKWARSLVILLALIFVSFASYSSLSKPTAFQQLWNPIFSSTGSVSICIGGGHPSSPVPTPPPLSLLDYARSHGQRIDVGDAVTLAGIAAVLQSNGKAYRILKRSGAASFKDLQQGPFVLIGANNNEWTLRLTKGLRFTFEKSASGFLIADKQNPGQTSWSFDYAMPYNQPTHDYGIVSRLSDPKTEQTALIVAGIGSWGTQAAGEFATNPIHLQKLESFAPKNWERKNLQVVIGTEVIDGSSGPPVVLAAHFW